MSKADQLAAKGDTKGIVRLNYLAMALLGLLFAIVCTLGMLGGSAMGTTLSNLAAKYAWIMAGLGAAGGMMRFVGFATLLRIMLSNEFWGLTLGTGAVVGLRGLGRRFRRGRFAVGVRRRGLGRFWRRGVGRGRRGRHLDLVHCDRLLGQRALGTLVQVRLHSVRQSG